MHGTQFKDLKSLDVTLSMYTHIQLNIGIALSYHCLFTLITTITVSQSFVHSCVTIFSFLLHYIYLADAFIQRNFYEARVKDK